MKPKDIIVKTALTGLVKIAAALAAFLMTLLITRNMSNNDSGLVLLAISILTVTAVIFRLGLDNIVLRKISSDFHDSASRGTLLTGIIWISIISIPTAIFASLNSEVIANNIFNKVGFSRVFGLAILALPAISIFMLLSKAFQAVYRVVLSVFFLNLGISLLFIIIFIATFNLGGVVASSLNSMTVYVISAYVVLIASLVLWNNHTKGDWGKANLFDRDLYHSSSNLWGAAISTLAVQWSSILIAGAYIDSFAFAQLSAALRTASLVSFILMIVNMVVAPRFALLWKKGSIPELVKLAKWSARGCFLIATPAVILVIIMAEQIMGMFGDGYSSGAIYLTILAIGQYFNVVTGSVGYLLTMSGHEIDYRRVTMIVGLLTIFMSYFLISNSGALGAAIAAAVGLTTQNLCAFFLVKKRLGFFPIG